MFPPEEPRAVTLQSTGIVDVFGNGDSAQQMAVASSLEREATEAMIVIISDLQIDKPLVLIITVYRINNYSRTVLLLTFICCVDVQVLEKLQQVFQGFESSGVAPLFVLMGSFVTKVSASFCCRSSPYFPPSRVNILQLIFVRRLNFY
jgi:hypothetical protein